eukprot:GHVR01000458.1.p1 GENE.GHVR01000458.1~~GHVR01000458.1.p1  ORF type:complete len:125 (+),score=2.57 GHVR01000458.1:1739-2113(+)
MGHILSLRLGIANSLKSGDQLMIIFSLIDKESFKQVGDKFICLIFNKELALYIIKLLFLRSTRIYLPNGSNDSEDIVISDGSIIYLMFPVSMCLIRIELVMLIPPQIYVDESGLHLSILISTNY